jgi:Amidohydrolase family
MNPKALIAFLVTFIVIGCTRSQLPSALAVTGATLIDVRDGSHIEDGTVVIEGERITAVGSAQSVRLPSRVRLVDARGKYVIPGLWDMHTHIYNQRQLETFFPLLVAHGVVGIRDAKDCFRRNSVSWGSASDMCLTSLLVGNTSTVRLLPEVPRARSWTNWLTRASISSKLAPCFRGNVSYPSSSGPKRGLPVAGHLPIAIRAAEASDLGLRSMEHLWEILPNISSREDQLRSERLRAVTSQLSTAEKELVVAFPETEPLLSTWDEQKASALFKKFIANHTWQTPTLVNFAVRGPALNGDASFWSDPNLALMPKDWVDSWRPARNQFLAGVPPSEVPTYIRRFEATHRAQLMLVQRMRSAGVDFLAGTDVSNWNFTVPGISLHQKLEQFVKAGLTALEALQTATINPVRYLGIQDSAGTIDVGKIADILILESDPTDDIANTKRISAVILGGQLIEQNELNQILEEARKRAADVQQ